MKKYIHLNEVFKKFKLKENRPSRSTIRQWVLKNDAIPYKCELCGNGGHWQGMKMPLELHHVDGNNRNNELKNLVWLCPNCHSQTLNWRRRK